MIVRPPTCSSVLRHKKLYAVAPANLQEARNIRRSRRGWQVFGPRGHWLTCLREEAHMNSSRGVHDQKAGWIRPDVLEGMHLTPRHLDEFAGLSRAVLRPDAELEGPIKHVERFVIRRMAVGRRPCARTHKRLNEAVSRVRIADEEAQQDAGQIVGVSLKVCHQRTFLHSCPTSYSPCHLLVCRAPNHSVWIPTASDPISVVLSRGCPANKVVWDKRWYEPEPVLHPAALLVP
jgi:hypothetical protein